MDYTYNFKVRFGDTDAYGIIHHSQYYHYFEGARFQFSADVLGFTEESKVKFPVIDSSCVYKNPLTFSLDNYVVKLTCTIINDVKLEFSYMIKDQALTKIYAYGKTTHVYLNEQGKLCVELPEWLRSRLIGTINQ